MVYTTPTARQLLPPATTPVFSTLVNEQLQRCTVAAMGAAWAAVPVTAIAAGGQAIEGVFVPDVDRFRRNGDIEMPWEELSVAGTVLLFVAFSAVVIFVTGRAADRRRRRPPRSILHHGRR